MRLLFLLARLIGLAGLAETESSQSYCQLPADQPANRGPIGLELAPPEPIWVCRLGSAVSIRRPAPRGPTRPGAFFEDDNSPQAGLGCYHLKGHAGASAISRSNPVCRLAPFERADNNRLARSLARRRRVGEGEEVDGNTPAGQFGF
jgi:hypothetical protein